MNQNSLWGALIVEELIRLGVCDFCIAPGSRSTPLVAAIARHPKARSHIFVDERSAAFFALGLSKYNNHPAVMITTSGTAISHAYPALLEAESTHTPLLLLSADRPPELRESGANQTIDQTKLFADHVRFFFDLPCPNPDFSPRDLLSLIDYAVSKTNDGPVHINCMFREPLEPVPVTLPELWHNDAPYTQIVLSERQTNWQAPPHKRAVLVIGALSSQRDQENALAMARAARCPVLCDAASGIRISDIPNALHPIETLLKYDKNNSFLTPDLIIHLGGSVVSKELPQWCAEQHVPVVQIQPFLKRAQTNAGMNIIAHIPASIGTLTHPLDVENLKQALDQCVENLCSHKLSEPSIARICAQSIPPYASLFVSNSMPIRDINRFATTSHPWIRTALNRGVSGIDGIVATAAGWTYASMQPAVLLIGDVASLHDIGSIVQLAKRNIPLLLCIINNGGGGIFSFLPISSQTDIFEPYFATTHDTHISSVTQALHIPTTTIDSIDALQAELNSFFAHPKFSICEIHTLREENRAWHREMEEKLTTILTQTLQTS